MTAFYIILGIIAFFILVLSIKCKVILEYSEDVNLWVKWLFIKKKILPLTAVKKEKKAKKDSKKDEKQTEEKANPEETQKKEKKPASKEQNFLKSLWKAHGYDGLVKMLKDAVNALNSFFGSVLRHVIIEQLVFNMRVATGDAASTAEEYGKKCAQLYPLFGAIASNMRIKEYDVNIIPDFLAMSDKSFLRCVIYTRPLFLVTAAVILVVKLLFDVVLKVLFKKPKGVENKKNKKSGKGGASI